MTRSLRFRLAARVAAAMTGSLIVISLASLAGARSFLDREIESSLLNVASIQASSVTQAETGAMRFHEWDLTPEDAAQVRDLNRFAQVWSASGESLLRTQYITQDLPLDHGALRQAAQGRLVTLEQRFQGMPIRSLYYPLERMGPMHARHVLQVAAPLNARDRLLGQLALLLGTITLLVGSASFAGLWWLAGRMLRPVHEIIDQAEAMKPGTLGRITAQADTREYERLVDVLNTMLVRLDAAFEAQRRFTADASHELRGPLTALRGEIEVALRREREPGEYRRVLTSNLEEVDRLSRMADELLTLARSDAGMMPPRLERTDLVALVRRVAERLAARAADRRVAVEVQSDATVQALVDRGLMEQLVWNLLENGIKFTPAGGRVVAHVSADSERALLLVHDTGPGLRRGDTERIFERFYRADDARTPTDAAGTGLGLAIVRAITAIHGGTVLARNASEGGALFEVTLPAGALTDTLPR